MIRRGEHLARSDSHRLWVCQVVCCAQEGMFLVTEGNAIATIRRSWLPWIAVVLLPLVLVWALPSLPSGDALPAAPSNGSRFEESPLPLTRSFIDDTKPLSDWITHAQFVDLDGDGRLEVLVCDARANRVALHRPDGSGGWQAETLAEELIAPAHATVVDLDGDGDRDLVVAVLGNILPDDGNVGRVVWLERTDAGFVPRVLLRDIRRVADVQPGDFDQDGDLDLIVAAFGYARGEILWLEQHAGQRFEAHRLHVAAGAIHVPVSDYDGDGDLDFATVVSQDDEEVLGFENDGKGGFTSHRLFSSFNDDLGSAGLVLSDLDRDGDADLLLPVGDNLEDIHSYPQAYHGCFWLENRGSWQFETRRIASFGGTYAAAPGDIDGDGDIDVALVSMFNDWDRPGHASLIWLENDGQQQFRPWQIDTEPQHLITVNCADLDGDGRAEIVAGRMQLNGPFSANGSLPLWKPTSRKAP